MNVLFEFSFSIISCITINDVINTDDDDDDGNNNNNKLGVIYLRF